MSRDNLERAIGSVVLGVLAGAVSACICAVLLSLQGLASGEIKLIEFPAPVQPRPWSSWDIWTIAISLAVGAMTTIFVLRSLFKSVESKRDCTSANEKARGEG